MATPIRLLGGLNNELQMDLLAQTIDITVERNASVFPTPNNVLKRFAIDTNTPRVMMEMNGIIIGDEGGVSSDGTTSEIAIDQSTPMRTLINFGSMLPTEPSSHFQPANTIKVHRTSSTVGIGTKPLSFPMFRTNQSYRKGSTTLLSNNHANASSGYMRKTTNGSIVTLVPKEIPLKFTGAHSASATGALTVASTFNSSAISVTIATDPNALGAAALLSVGDRVVNSAGALLGIVSALSDTTVTFASGLPVSVSANDGLFINPKCFNRRNEFVGYVTDLHDDSSVAQGGRALWSIQFADAIETDIRDRDILYINQSAPPIEQLLNSQSFKFVPSYWLEDPTRNPKGSQVSGGDSNFGVTGNAHIGIRFMFDAFKTPSLLGGSDNPTVTQLATRTRRASAIRSNSEDATHYDATVSIPIKGLTTTAGKNPAVIMAQLFEDAMELTANISPVNVSPNGLVSKTIPDAFKVTRQQSIVMIEQTYKPSRELQHPETLSTVLREIFAPQVFQDNGTLSANAAKSAGDKVQDLVGLVSNSHKDVDMFRGIQIPYDSLITSSGVSGVARNFFLTFGSLPASEKGSVSNTRSASELMNQLLLTGDTGGNIDEGQKEGFFDQIIDAVVPETVQSLVGFLTNLLEDTFLTLTTPGHGNDGGVRIMPEKLHVRYDAGNNYYAFTLLLVATDFVIGV